MGLGLTVKKKTTTSGSSQKTTPQTATQSATQTTASNTSTAGANTDFMKLMQEAAGRGDYKAAAQYEQQRNNKINSMNSSGTNVGGYTPTNQYTGWLDNTDYGTIGRQLMDSGASKELVEQAYNNRLNKASGTVGMEQYVNDDIMKEMLAYINTPEFDYDEMLEQRPEFYDSYQGISEDLLNKILSREDFTYDPSDDPLFGYYQDMYRREGDRARENTLADIAASAGGMNSWAVTAAQQAQNDYNAQMTDKIPELYQLAYQMYLNDKASDVENLGLLQQMSDSQYGRYRDQMSDFYNDLNFAYGMYRDDVADGQWNKQFDYNVGRDQISDDRYKTEWEYGVSTDQYNREQAERDSARAWALDLISAGVTPDDATLQKAGITLDQAKQILANEQQTTARRTSSSNTGGTPSGMDLDGLFEAALASGSPYVFLENNFKKYGVSKYSDNLVDSYDEWADNKDKERQEQVLTESIGKLNIGPVGDETVDELLHYALLVDDGNGGVKWANGANEKNWEEALWLAKSGASVQNIGKILESMGK